MKTILILLCLLSGCGIFKKTQPQSNDLASLEPRVEAIRAWMPTCEGYVSKGDCNQDDSTLFAGLACLSGEELGCETVRRSIGPDGRIWRSPKGMNNTFKNSASRDMFIGVMSYVIATRDTEILLRVNDYLIKNNYMICPDADDGRCDMTDNMKNILDHVRMYVGLPPLQDVSLYSEVLSAQAHVSPVGFELHLIGTQMLMLKKLGLWNSSLQIGAQHLSERQPENAFFILLAYGPSEKFVEKMNLQIPAGVPSIQDQWGFERRDDEQAWRNSMGWEFVTIYNLARTW